jgi:hypothetical protein
MGGKFKIQNSKFKEDGSGLPIQPFHDFFPAPEEVFSAVFPDGIQVRPMDDGSGASRFAIFPGGV